MNMHKIVLIKTIDTTVEPIPIRVKLGNTLCNVMDEDAYFERLQIFNR